MATRKELGDVFRAVGRREDHGTPGSPGHESRREDHGTPGSPGHENCQEFEGAPGHVHHHHEQATGGAGENLEFAVIINNDHFNLMYDAPYGELHEAFKLLGERANKLEGRKGKDSQEQLETLRAVQDRLRDFLRRSFEDTGIPENDANLMAFKFYLRIPERPRLAKTPSHLTGRRA